MKCGILPRILFVRYIPQCPRRILTENLINFFEDCFRVFINRHGTASGDPPIFIASELRVKIGNNRTMRPIIDFFCKQRLPLHDRVTTLSKIEELLKFQMAHIFAAILINVLNSATYKPICNFPSLIHFLTHIILFKSIYIIYIIYLSLYLL